MKKSILIAVTMVLAIIIGAMAVLSEGFKNWEVSTWFDDEETKTETPAEDETTEEETGTATSAVLYATSETLDSEETKEEKKTRVELVKATSDMTKVKNKWTVVLTDRSPNVDNPGFAVENKSGINPALSLTGSGGILPGNGGYVGASFEFNDKVYSYNGNDIIGTTIHDFDDACYSLYGAILCAVYEELDYTIKDYNWQNIKTSELFLDDFLNDFLGFYDGSASKTIKNLTLYNEGVSQEPIYDVTFYNVYYLEEPEAKRGYEFVGFYADETCTEEYSLNYFSESDRVYALYEECELTTGEKIVEWLDENKVAIIVSAIIILAMGGLIYLIARTY